MSPKNIERRKKIKFRFISIGFFVFYFIFLYSFYQSFFYQRVVQLLCQKPVVEFIQRVIVFQMTRHFHRVHNPFMHRQLTKVSYFCFRIFFRVSGFWASCFTLVVSDRRGLSFDFSKNVK